MSKNTPNTPDELLGNTKTKSSIREQQCKMYCFTYNNYNDESVIKLKNTLNTLGKWIFGYEIGEKGTPHLQGFINLNVKKSMSCLIKTINIKEIHFEKCKGSQGDNEKYCTKDNNYESNYFIKDEELEILSPKLFKPWMVDIDKLTDESADKRAVYWFWEPIGGVGKSSFCKYLCYAKNAIYIDEGKKSDIINIIYNVKSINSKSIIVIDIPRNNGNKVSYKAIEQIKNGMICNTKYETGMKLFNSPHVIIFSNMPPDESELSKDRWRIFDISENVSEDV